MARQIYAFAVAKERGWTGPADRLVSHGIDFISKHGRSDKGAAFMCLDEAEREYDARSPFKAAARA